MNYLNINHKKIYARMSTGEVIRKISIPVVILSQMAFHFLFFSICSSVSKVSSAIIVSSFQTLSEILLIYFNIKKSTSQEFYACFIKISKKVSKCKNNLAKFGK